VSTLVKDHVDLVMVSYNSRLVLPVFFQSLRKFTKSPFHLWVIDNNSTDKSQAFLKTISRDKFFRPKMTLVLNKSNTGVAKAWNQAVRLTSSPLMVFLNPDLVFTKHWLRRLTTSAARHKKAMVVGAKILNPDGTIYHAGAISRIRGKGEPNRPGFYDEEKIVHWIQGSCFLVKRTIFQQIGGFDEQFFVYGEEIDFCHRVRKAGFNVLYSPVPIYHWRRGSQIPRQERLKLRKRSARLLKAKWSKKGK
jgi:GT2 family glycosyltransferase